MKIIACPVCKREGTKADIERKGYNYSYIYCENCGDYELTETARYLLKEFKVNNSLSDLLSKNHKNGNKLKLNSMSILEFIDEEF